MFCRDGPVEAVQRVRAARSKFHHTCGMDNDIACAACHHRVEHLCHLNLLADVRTNGECRASCRSDLGNDLVGGLRRSTILHGNLKAIRCKTLCDGSADAP